MKSNQINGWIINLDTGPHPRLHGQLVDLCEPLPVATSAEHVEAILFGVKDG